MAHLAYVSASPYSTPERLLYTLADGFMIESGMELTTTGTVNCSLPLVVSMIESMNERGEEEEGRLTQIKALSIATYKHELTEDDLFIMECEDCDFLDSPHESLKNLMDYLVSVDSFGDHSEVTMLGDEDDYVVVVLQQACGTPLLPKAASPVAISEATDIVEEVVAEQARTKFSNSDILVASRKSTWFRRVASKVSKAFARRR